MKDRIEEIFDQVLDSPEPLRRFAESIAKDAAAKEREVNQELVEALRQIIALDRTEENEWDAVERVIPIMVEIARAAIAKAGEQA